MLNDASVCGASSFGDGDRIETEASNLAVLDAAAKLCGPPGRRLFPHLIDQRARDDPQRAFYILTQSLTEQRRRTVTYADFARAIDRAAAWITTKLGKMRGRFPTVTVPCCKPSKYLLNSTDVAIDSRGHFLSACSSARMNTCLSTWLRIFLISCLSTCLKHKVSCLI